MQILPSLVPEKIGLIGHIIIDYPNPSAAREIVKILVDNGVALIELQIPFSEPIADGPIFSKANHEAVAEGVTLPRCYDFMLEMTNTYSIPFVFMTYANIVYKQGFNLFVEKAKAAGAQGAIIPDLPLDVADEYVRACHSQQFSPISVVSPNISFKRLQTLQPYLDGFIYAVARAGVTGVKTNFDKSIEHYINNLRSISNLPVAVGFGISCAQDLDYLKGIADYAVIGTQTIRSFEANGIQGVSDLWQSLAGNNKIRQKYVS